MQNQLPPGRVLAPAALGVFFVIFLIVVITSFGGGDGGGGKESNGGSQIESSDGGTTTSATQERFADRKVYVVKPGDNFASIATKTGVDVDTLRELNPTLDPQALISGQRVKLKPE